MNWNYYPLYSDIFEWNLVYLELSKKHDESALSEDCVTFLRANIAEWAGVTKSNSYLSPSKYFCNKFCSQLIA